MISKEKKRSKVTSRNQKKKKYETLKICTEIFAFQFCNKRDVIFFNSKKKERGK